MREVVKRSDFNRYQIKKVSLLELFPGIEELAVRLEDVRFLGAKNNMITTSPNDMVALCFLCRYSDAKNLFEIGTNLGLTTLQLAANTSEDARIITMDLPPHEQFMHSKKLFTMAGPDCILGDVGHHFKSSNYAPKITQLRANSQRFDFSSFSNSMDYVFIDGCHSYSSVKKDTGSAFNILGTSGLIIWHDYNTFIGVNQYLAELAESEEVYHIEHTSLAVYRRAVKRMQTVDQ